MKIKRQLRRVYNQMWISHNWAGFRQGYITALRDVAAGRVVPGTDDEERAAAQASDRLVTAP